MAILNMPVAFKVLLSFLALDLLIYFQHVLFHAVPVLWRFHMVHHSDGHLDLTTGLRFHPVEMILSAMIKAAAFLALGTESTPIGLTQYQQDLPTGLFSLLKLPFTGDLGPYHMTGSSRIFHHFKDTRQPIRGKKILRAAGMVAPFWPTRFQDIAP